MTTKRKKTFTSFEDWKSMDIKKKLGIRHVEDAPELVDWLTVSGDIPDEWKGLIEKLRLSLFDYYSVWSEEDLKMKFISPLLITLPFTGDNYNSFAHCWLTAKIGDYQVKGFADWLAATGLTRPESPYFFLHEYKPIGGRDPDPEGQVLMAMLAAQSHNTQNRPIYGCFVLGNYWRFLVLNGNHYSMSQGFDATNVAELKLIWLVLHKTSQMIAEWAATQPV